MTTNVMMTVIALLRYATNMWPNANRGLLESSVGIRIADFRDLTPVPVEYDRARPATRDAVHAIPGRGRPRYVRVRHRAAYGRVRGVSQVHVRRVLRVRVPLPTARARRPDRGRVPEGRTRAVLPAVPRQQARVHGPGDRGHVRAHARASANCVRASAYRKPRSRTSRCCAPRWRTASEGADSKPRPVDGDVRILHKGETTEFLLFDRGTEAVIAPQSPRAVLDTD